MPIFYLVNTSSEYPPSSLAAKGILNFEIVHRGKLATTLLILALSVCSEVYASKEHLE